QADGKIIVAGSAQNSGNYYIALVRYNVNGTLDTGFGAGGKVTTSIGSYSYADGNGLALQADGKIVVVGSASSYRSPYEDFAVLRYNTNGSLDGSFGNHGKVTTDFR